MTWHQPKDLEQALSLLKDGNAAILAGGTDIFPAHVDRPIATPVIDISHISELDRIQETDTHWHIGAGVSWSKLIETPLPAAFDGLKQAGREVGSRQIQNRATIAGNICNASPAADGIPPLLVMDAKIKLSSLKSQRTIALQDFVTGNRKTKRQDDELVSAITIEKQNAAGHSAFTKLGSRTHLVISIAMAAARLVVNNDGTVDALAVSIGSCAATPQRLAKLEQEAKDCPASDLSNLAKPEHFTQLSPLDDIRGTAEYRRHAACELTRRLLTALAGQKP